MLLNSRQCSIHNRSQLFPTLLAQHLGFWCHSLLWRINDCRETLFIHGGLWGRWLLYLTFRLWRKNRRAEKHQGHKETWKKDGEMDDETCMKGLWDFIIHVTYNRKIPETDSSFHSSWLILLNIQVMPSDLSITSVELDFKIRAGKINPFHIKENVTWHLKHQKHQQFSYTDKSISPQ